MSRLKRIDADELRTVIGTRFRPIALGSFDDVRRTTVKGRDGKPLVRAIELGKAPRRKRWQQDDGTPAESVVEEAIANGWNVGVALGPEDLVLDIDRRNGGDEGFDNLIADHGLDQDAWPLETTPTGGRHYFLRKPADLRITKTLHHPDDDPKHPESRRYRGVEFLTAGQQVLIAGCVHPKGGRYERDPLSLGREDAPTAPQVLLDALARPISTGSAKGGQATPEQIARALTGLDVLEFRDHDRWFELMCAAHHASDGDALEEFIEWSTSDPQYTDYGHAIAARWDSLHRNKPDGIKLATLNWHLQQAERNDLAIPENAAADFAEDDLEDSWLEEGLSNEPPLKLSEINADNIGRAFRVVNIAGKVRVLYWGKSPIDRKVRVPEIWTIPEFKNALLNKFVSITKKVEKDGEEKTETERKLLANWWLSRKGRYTYDGLIFDSNASEESERDEINLWRGFGVEENPGGDWSLMRAHIRDVLANGDPKSDSYIIRWLAWVLQNPTTPAEVASVFMSPEEGTGKGTLGRAMCRIFGGHGLHITQRSHLVGKFNSHFMMAGFLFSDEAVWPGNKEDDGVIKGIVTEPTLTIEPKGVNAFSMPNHLSLMFASNAPWVVNAASDARRYAVFKVSDKRKQDVPYFKALNAQLDGGGLGAMLHDLRAMDLKGWHPRNNIPQTEALAEQKMESAAPELQWLAGLLNEGVLPCQHLGRGNEVRAKDLYIHARQNVRGLAHWSDTKFGKFLNERGVRVIHSDGAVRVFPPLGEMRAKWMRERPWWIPFESAVDDWIPEL